MAEKKEALKTAKIITEYNTWLGDYFIPAVEAIEKAVMFNIQQEFNITFQKWVTMLIEDPTKEAEIDDSFTPMIRQDGYDQEAEYLSGGEKTSIALAYRLALNTIVQKVSTGMKSNLLILDEPTDGFSKDQLYKVRDILEELNCPQTILVSHERELRSFAENIYEVTKSMNDSKVTRVKQE